MIRILVSIATLAIASLVHGATLQIISAKAGDEGAIIITWANESNAVYRIEYAPELVDGGTMFRTLYEDYPSHGTNTFWMDNGAYEEDPLT